MKGWKIKKPLALIEDEIVQNTQSPSVAKVKITKTLITLSDVLRYNGEIDGENVALGSSGVGVVCDTETNLFGFEKGKHVYISPTRECDACFNCLNGNANKCNNLQVAGIDFDGFLCDFACADQSKLFVLPEHISDFEALFIEHISLAISVVDRLNIQKGDYVAIIGANNFGNILAQLLIYYQAVPIILTNNDEDLEIAKKSGIYYALGNEDNWQKEVLNITGGNMTKSLVYVSDCNIPTTKAFALATPNSSIALVGVTYKSNNISIAQAIKKQLQINCINTCTGYIASSINLIANKAINLSHLKLDTENYQNVPLAFEKMNKMLEETGKIYETVIDHI